MLAIVGCNYNFADITDADEWIAAIDTNNAARLSGFVLGQKPKGTFTKKRIASCTPEVVIGGEKTLTFQDYNTDTGVGGCAVHTFYNTILANAGRYRFGYWTCDNKFYGLIDNFQLEIDEVIEDSNLGNRYMDGTVTWTDIQMICPVYVDLDYILAGIS